MDSDKIRWIKIADSLGEICFKANNMTEAMADDKKICLGRHNDQVYAFAAKCPHASGQLSEGYIDPLGNVVCPIHRYKFSMKNGRNVSGEGYYLKHWPIEVREDGVYVGLEKKGFWGF